MRNRRTSKPGSMRGAYYIYSMPKRAPSMLLTIIRVGPNTYITGVSRACDEAMAVPLSVSRASLDPILCYFFFFFGYY
jgi:hypothetical protein